MAVSAQCNNQVKNKIGVRGGDPDGGVLNKSINLVFLFLRHFGDDLQLFFRFACKDTCGGSGCNPTQPARIRHNHAFYVFYDVAACKDFHFLGHCPEGFTGYGRTVGNRNRFRAAHGRNEFFFEDGDILPVFNTVFIHLDSPVNFLLFDMFFIS